jgi:UDP-2,3-diacylglucosamine hydrolase
VQNVLFASDLHLSPTRPDQIERFLALLARCQTAASAVYLLGDLVEFWLGDDDTDPVHQRLIAALRELTVRGVTLAVTTGNRDFLIGPRFSAVTGAALLADYAVIDLHGTSTLLTHGDLLCVKDVQYQQFRRSVREPARQQQFLALPLAERRRIATETRSGTQKSMLDKDEYIMDVDDAEVARVMGVYQVRRLIHGHTHRAAVHSLTLADGPGERVVLGDWYGGAEVYWATPGSRRLVSAEALLHELG